MVAIYLASPKPLGAPARAPPAEASLRVFLFLPEAAFATLHFECLADHLAPGCLLARGQNSLDVSRGGFLNLLHPVGIEPAGFEHRGLFLGLSVQRGLNFRGLVVRDLKLRLDILF